MADPQTDLIDAAFAAAKASAPDPIEAAFRAAKSTAEPFTGPIQPDEPATLSAHGITDPASVHVTGPFTVPTRKLIDLPNPVAGLKQFGKGFYGLGSALGAPHKGETSEAMRAGSDMIEGIFQLAAPLVAAQAAEAPLATAWGLLKAYVSGKAGTKAAETLTDNPDAHRLAGDLAAAISGTKSVNDFAEGNITRAADVMAAAGKAVGKAGQATARAAALAGKLSGQVGKSGTYGSAAGVHVESPFTEELGGLTGQPGQAQEIATAAAEHLRGVEEPATTVQGPRETLPLPQEVPTDVQAAYEQAKRVTDQRGGRTADQIATLPQGPTNQWTQDEQGRPTPTVAVPPPPAADLQPAVEAAAIGHPYQASTEAIQAEQEAAGSASLPRGVSEPDPVHAELEAARQQVEPSPTAAQKEAGNYQKGHVTIHGLDITIENQVGSTRSGVSKAGEPWSVTMPADYGYVKRTEGADGDHVDVYIGPNPTSGTVYVVDQVNPETGTFDEHKAILGADSREQATALYQRGFSDQKGAERIGGVTAMPVADFKAWAEHGDTTKPLADETETSAAYTAAKGVESPHGEVATPPLTDGAHRPSVEGSGAVESGSGDADAARPRVPAEPFERFVKRPASEHAHRFTPEVTRELTRLEEELSTFPHTPRTWTDLSHEHGLRGNASGGHAQVTGAVSGAEAYRDILSQSPVNVVTSGRRKGELAKEPGGSQAKILHAVKRVLASKDITNNLMEGAVKVAELRAAGDYRVIKPPALPPSWGTVSPAVEAALDAAYDAPSDADAWEEALHKLQDEEASGDVDFDPETLEAQPRLPEAGSVREQEHATPQFEAPFSLSGEAEERKAVEPDLFGNEKPSFSADEPANAVPANRYKSDNPFAARAKRARAYADKLNRPNAHEEALRDAFPLGVGQGGKPRAGAGKRIDASVNRAVAAVSAEKNARYLEAQADAFDAGRINAQGRRISPTSLARSAKRDDLKDRQTERIQAAKDQLAGRPKWTVPSAVYADATGNLGGGARALMLGDHHEAVVEAVRAGQDVPTDVLAEYPDLIPKGAKKPEAKSGGFTVYSTVLPGAEKLEPAVEKIAQALRNDTGLLLSLIGPAHVGVAPMAAGSARAYTAARDQQLLRVQKELAATKRVMDSWSKEKVTLFWRVMEGQEPAQSLPRSDRQYAQTLGAVLKRWTDLIVELGLIEDYLEHYFPHEWVKGSVEGDLLRKLFGRRPMQGAESFRKHRSIPTMEEGLKIGLEPVSWNPADQVFRKVAEMARSVRARGFRDDMKRMGLYAYVAAGKTKPEAIRDWQRVPDEALGTVFGARVPEQTYGQVIAGHYYAPREVVRLVENMISRGLHGRSVILDTFNAAGNTSTAALLGWSSMHLWLTGLEHTISKWSLGQESLARGEWGSAAKAFAQVGPHGLIRDLVRGYKLVHEFYGRDATANATAGFVGQTIQGGGGFGRSLFEAHDAPQQFMTNLRRLLGAVQSGAPKDAASAAGKALWHGAATVAEGPTLLIMNYWVPYLKAAAFHDLAQMELRRLGEDATLEDQRKVYGKAWDAVDNRFGQLRYDNLFWNNTFKQILMSLFLSVGWQVGSVRAGGGALKQIPLTARKLKAAIEGGGHEPPRIGEEPPKVVGKGQTPAAQGYVEPWLDRDFSWLVSLVAIVVTIDAVKQYLSTGKRLGEDKDGTTDWKLALRDAFAPRNGRIGPSGREERDTPISYAKDFYGWLHHPVTTTEHKLRPILHTVAEMVENEDFYGDAIYDGDDPLGARLKDLLLYALKSAEPISYENAKRRMAEGVPFSQILKEAAKEQAVPFIPASAELERSDLEQYLHDLIPPSHRTKADAAKAAARRSMREEIRQGDPAAAHETAQAAGLSKRSEQAVRRSERVGALQSAFDRVTWPEAVKAMDLATDTERASLRGPFLRKALRALQATRSSAERARIQQQRNTALKQPQPTS